MSVKTYKAEVVQYRKNGGSFPNFRSHGISERQAQAVESSLTRKQQRGPGRFAGRNEHRRLGRR